MVNLNEVDQIKINNKIYTFSEILQILAKAEKFDAIESDCYNAIEIDTYDDDYFI